MKKHTATLLASAITAIASAPGAFAQGETFMEAMKDSKSSLAFRYRMEQVSDDAKEKDATANTLQTRLNFATGSYQGFSGFVEFDQVSELLEVDYNTGVGDPNYEDTATVADPEGTDLNQAYFQYSNTNTTVKMGRQRILLDNQRFVGGVGWRQNEQTYDGLSVKYTGVEKLSLFGAYIKNVNRIFGDDRAAPGDNVNKTVLLNAKYAFGKVGALTGYKYLIDNETLVHYSTDTYGLRFDGAMSNFAYSAELAVQSNAGDNENDYSASYTALEGSYTFSPIKITLGYEVLGADGSDGEFITPLATLHKFQGWTDKFLGGGTGNINGGIQDLYASIGGKFGPVNGAVVYHQYSADDSAVAGVDSYGSELGFVLKGKAGPVGLLLKASNFTADDDSSLSDANKVWLMSTLKF